MPLLPSRRPVVLEPVSGCPNLAVNMPTTMSSNAYSAVSSRAVDGNNDPNWGGASCTRESVAKRISPDSSRFLL